MEVLLSFIVNQAPGLMQWMVVGFVFHLALDQGR
jgi:hypothetical protein